MKKLSLLVLGTLIMLAVAVYGIRALAQEEKTELSKLPPAVQQTIAQHVGTGKIVEIEKDTESGKEVYDVEFTKDGKTTEFQVAADGKYLGEEKESEKKEGKEGGEAKSEKTIPLTEAPAAVQQAVQEALKGQPLKALTVETEEGVTTYEAEFEVNGLPSSVDVAENGDILAIERGIAEKDLPASITSAIQRKYPQAKIAGAEAVQEFSFEVQIVIDGKKQEIAAFSTGKLKKSNGDDDDDDDDKDTKKK